MSDYDWGKIKEVFESTQLPVRTIAEQFGVKSPSAISKRANKKGWNRPPLEPKKGIVAVRKKRDDSRKKTEKLKKAMGSAGKAKPGDKRIGSKFWEARSSSGRNPIFGSWEELWVCCVEYFEWVEANPLYEEKAFSFQGEVNTHDMYKMRAMTITALCVFLDINMGTWREYGKREDFAVVVAKVEAIIRSQKFEGAAADLLNSNIIARDLGLADKKELSGPDGQPIETIGADMDVKKAARLYSQMIRDEE